MPKVKSGQCELCDEHSDHLYTVRIRDDDGDTFTVLVCEDCRDVLNSTKKEGA